jgi:hypothetical protein
VGEWPGEDSDGLLMLNSGTVGVGISVIRTDQIVGPESARLKVWNFKFDGRKQRPLCRCESRGYTSTTMESGGSKVRLISAFTYILIRGFTVAINGPISLVYGRFASRYLS